MLLAWLPRTTRARTEAVEGEVGTLRPHLDLEIECERPLAGAARYRLAGAKNVRFGRGEKRFAGVESDVVSIEIPDPWMSSQHAELRLVEHGWQLAISSRRTALEKRRARSERCRRRR